MSTNLKNKSFITMEQLTPTNLRALIDLAHNLKGEKKRGIDQRKFYGKNLLMLFQLGSTRTRCAFETSANDLGMGTTFLSNSHFGTKETIEDSIEVFNSMYDCIVYRGHSHEELEELVKYASIPVINGFTPYEHPTQMLADLMTLEEEWGRNGFRNKTFVYIGNGFNGVARSYAVTCALANMNFRFVGPNGAGLTEEDEIFVKNLYTKYSPLNYFEQTEDITKVEGADVLSTENWGDFTAPIETWIPGIKKFRQYQVNKEVLEMTKNPEVLFIHMLPASHNCKHKSGKELMSILDKETADFVSKGLEVTDAVFKQYKPLIFREAENRQHTIKAVMHACIGK